MVKNRKKSELNLINDHSIYHAANYLEFIFINKGNHLFHEGDESNIFMV